MYVELCAKSNFSFLEGASHPEEMVERAVQLGLRGLALTDRNGVYGVAKGYTKAKDHPDFKYMVGAELTLRDHPNLIIIARDRRGYGLMCRALTASHAGKEKGDAYLTWQEFLSFASREEARGGWVVIPQVPELGRNVGRGVRGVGGAHGTSDVSGTGDVSEADGASSMRVKDAGSGRDGASGASRANDINDVKCSVRGAESGGAFTFGVGSSRQTKIISSAGHTQQHEAIISDVGSDADMRIFTSNAGSRVEHGPLAFTFNAGSSAEHRSLTFTSNVGSNTMSVEISAQLAALRDLFGPNVYLPLVRYLDGHDHKRTEEALRLQKRFGILPIATNDARYHEKSRKVLHDVLLATKEGLPLEKCGYKLFGNGERYIKSPRQMARLYKDLPEALIRTLDVADSCHFSLSELRYRYPSEWIPRGHTAQSWLEELVWRGAGERYKVWTSDLPSTLEEIRHRLPEKVRAQIEHELKLTEQMQFADYFLTIYDIVQFARSRDILCQGRGSAANSIICYVLGITAIDPIQMELLFERFISVERGEPPDIDVDFEHERREEVIQYIYEKYGRDRAAMVSAVVTYRTRSALREVAKAFGVPVGTLSAKKVERDFEELTQDMKIPQLRERIQTVADELKGFPRHLSIHSGGFTLSADPIIEIVPVEPARMEGRTIIQWDKYDLDTLGLLKVDILSLGMLSALKKSLDLVGKKLYEIPHDDPATYEMIRRVDTVGTFQIESRAQMSMLGRLRPRTFYDLVIEVAIVRPGPIVGQMVHPYLRRRRGLEKVRFPHPKVREILQKTLGVPLFQEQVMKLAIQLAGFSPGEADQLRRAIGAWRSTGSIEKMRERLRDGMLKSGLPRSFADEFFEQIKGFAHYGFPESHAASFALIAYASCYMKCHHPAEFTMSLINSQPMGFYSNHTLITDVERPRPDPSYVSDFDDRIPMRFVKVLPVHPNLSDWDCKLEALPHVTTPHRTSHGATPYPYAIRLGFRVVKGLGEDVGRAIVAERERGGEFRSLHDFIQRMMRGRGEISPHVTEPAERQKRERSPLLRRDILYRLAMANAFECFGDSPRDTLWKLLELEGVPGLFTPPGEQMTLFEQALHERADDSVHGPGRESGHHPASGQVRKQGSRPTEAGWGSRLVANGQAFHVPNSQTERTLFQPLSDFETLQEDFNTFGLTTHGHPMKVIKKKYPHLPQISAEEVKRRPSGATIKVAGLVIIRQRPPTAKGCVFSTLEDESGFLDLIIHPKAYDKCKEVFLQHCFVIVTGRIQKDKRTTSIIVQSMKAVFPEKDLDHTPLPIEPTQYF